MGDFNLYLTMPVVVLAAYGLLSLVLSPMFRGHGAWLGGIALLGIGIAGVFTFQLWREWAANGAMKTAADMVHVDGFGLFATFILLAITAMTVIGSMRFLEREEADHGEFYPLVLIAAAGMVLMLHTTHLVVVLVGLEVFSVALYILCGLTRGRVRSVEASLKYFLMGAFSSGFFVYGMALLYGATGSLDLASIADAAAADPTPMLWMGMGLVFIGLAFKIAVVPFHHWVPDVYQGAPTNVTGFMAAATKTAAFVALLRFLVGAFGERQDMWVPLVVGLSMLTMTVGNLVALAQTDIKRLLAFSSISHAGYLMIGLVCTPAVGVRAILVYLLAYAFMTVGAFAVAAAVGRGDATSERGYDLASWAGLGWRRPGLAVPMSIFLFSLAGVPPTAGFLAKYVIFSGAVESGHYALAIVGVLNATVGAYYYLRVVVGIWMREVEDATPSPSLPLSMITVLGVAVLATILLGILPGPVLDLARELGESLT